VRSLRLAALGMLAALKRPRIGASVAIWVGTAIATAAHPAALITAAACGVALAGLLLVPFAHDKATSSAGLPAFDAGDATAEI